MTRRRVHAVKFMYCDTLGHAVGEEVDGLVDRPRLEAPPQARLRRRDLDVLQHGLDPTRDHAARAVELGEQVERAPQRLQLGLRLQQIVELDEAKPADVQSSGEAEGPRERIG